MCQCRQGSLFDSKDILSLWVQKKLEDITSCCNMPYQKRTTKCPCFKSMRPCSMDCQCKGCTNTYDKKSEKEKVSPQGKRRIDRENKSYKKKRTSEYMRIEIGKATPSGWTLLETTNLYYAITYLQVRGEEVDLFLVVAMYNNIATYSQREFDCQYQVNPNPQKQIVSFFKYKTECRKQSSKSG